MPIRLPSTRLPVTPAPVSTTPESKLPEMMLAGTGGRAADRVAGESLSGVGGVVDVDARL